MIVCFTAAIVAHRFSKLSDKNDVRTNRSNPSKFLSFESLFTIEKCLEPKYTFPNIIFSTNQKHSYAVRKRDVIVAETILRHKMKSVESNKNGIQ